MEERGQKLKGREGAHSNSETVLTQYKNMYFKEPRLLNLPQYHTLIKKFV